jgi:hypothetical protein
MGNVVEVLAVTYSSHDIDLQGASIEVGRVRFCTKTFVRRSATLTQNRCASPVGMLIYNP